VTAGQIEKGKPGRYGDGAGLYLLVRSKEAKFWLFRYKGKRGGKMRLGPAVGRRGEQESGNPACCTASCDPVNLTERSMKDRA
jgi:hypothetical protein